MNEHYLDALRYAIGRQEISDEIGNAIAEAVSREILDPEYQSKPVGLLVAVSSNGSILLQKVNEEQEEAIQRMITIQQERVKLTDALIQKVDEYVLNQIEFDNQCKYKQKYPSIFSKSIRSQKPSKKPYIKRLRRVIRM